MKIEIAHDALAKRVFEKASSDDKMRLKAKGFIEERYNDFINPKRRVLLRVSDLNYIEPYLKSLEQDLTPEVAEFIKRSQNRRFWVRLSAVFLILAAFGVLIGTLIKVNSTKEHFAALSTSLSKAKDSLNIKNDNLRRVVEANDSLFRTLNINKDSLKKSEFARNKLVLDLEKTIAERDEALVEKGDALEKLRKAYAELDKKNQELNAKKQKAENEVVALNNEKNNLTKAQNLCQKAYDYQKKGDKESAFRAAAEAWQLDPNSTIAVDILRKINSEITGSPNWSVPPKKIIDDHAKRFKFKPR
jgi:tetratricopeptide (TPR) repeat protein